MINGEKISSIQLVILLIGFIFGSSAIITPSVAVKQDAWISYILAWIGGYILIGIYVLISKLNPSLSLIDILKKHFGKFFGTIIGILYIWYFIHLGALVFRNISEFLSISIYTESPLIFIIISISLIIFYSLKKGLRVFCKLSEIIVPITLLLTALIFVLVSKFYNLKNFFPLFEQGFFQIFKVALHTLTFPFGETVVFLMIFPFLYKYDNLFKNSYIAMTIVGFMLLSIIISNLLALGGEILSNSIFPSHLTINLIPKIAVEPFISVNLIIGASVKIFICIFGAIVGIKQLLNTNDFKPFITPIVIFSIILSVWLYDNVIEMVDWAGKIYPYYAMPFQIIIPLITLIISLIKKKSLNKQ